MSTQSLDWTATDEREPWRLFNGNADGSIGVDHFGASAAYQKICQESGITAERVAAAAHDSLARVRA